MIVSIHQPNFMPWYPYFQKMQQADVFVVLENCQFEKNGFQNRFNMNNTWYTMSTTRKLIPINEKPYLKHTQDWETIKRKLPEYSEILSMFDDCICDSLSKTNGALVKKIKNLLQIDTEIVFDYPTDFRSTERLVDICKKNNATKYLSGISGKEYLNLNLFEEQNIEVIFQKEEDMLKKSIIEFLKEEGSKND
jgi:hypothetical protein